MRRGVVGLLLLGIAGLGAVRWRGERAFPPEPHDEASARVLQQKARVILITLDGPLREDVLAGALMPGMKEAVAREGVALPADAASSMALSLPGYQAIAAGALTSCHDNDCPRIGVETLAERLATALHLAPEEVAVFASWSRQVRAATSRDGVAFVDAPPDGPPQPEGPPWKNARFDEETFSRARAHWQAHHPRFLHLALLDTDEWAHEGHRAEYEQALRDTDARVQEVLRWISELPEEEAKLTTVIISADHGRGRGKKWTEHGFFDAGSGEIFVIALGPLVARGAAAEIDQRDLRPTIERLFGLCPQQSEGRAIQAIVGALPCAR